MHEVRKNDGGRNIYYFVVKLCIGFSRGTFKLLKLHWDEVHKLPLVNLWAKKSHLLNYVSRPKHLLERDHKRKLYDVEYRI